ncbi:MAG: alpha/beta fold hydrolase [Anaerolineales bacterium]|nr:alpha/beta fold hydrolase [Anaerolineales bacterium]
MPVYQINGQPIHVVKTGTAHRQTAVLIHGWSSSWYAMYPLLELLHERYRCVAVDLPGYGESPPLEGPITIKRYVDLLAALIREVSEGPVILVGHAMGGMISITLSLHYPELVERMVLICPTITGRLSRFINVFISPITLMERFGFGSYIVSGVEQAFVGLTDRLMRPASFAERTAIPDEVYARLRSDARRMGQGRVRAECFRAMSENNLRDQLKQVETPALVIWGAEDNTVPLSDASIVDDEWWDADLRILPKAGHWPHFERPNATNRLISAYLGIARYKHNRKASREANEERVDDQAVAYFLTSSDIGYGLNQAQRLRLAAQFRQYHFDPYQPIVQTAELGREMYLIFSGSVEVWRNLQKEAPSLDDSASFDDIIEKHNSGMWRKVAILRPGQVAGELSLLDDQRRSADLIAGEGGAVMLALGRNRLLALCEDDSALGTKVLWNIGRALSKRMRFILWQQYYAPVQELEESRYGSNVSAHRQETNIYQQDSDSDNIYNLSADQLLNYDFKDEA